MSEDIHVNTIPFEIEIKGNDTKQVYFNEHIREFILKFDTKPKVRISLKNIDGKLSSYNIEKNIEQINLDEFKFIILENKDIKPINIMVLNS